LIKHFRPNQFWTNNAAHRNPDARRIDHLVRSLELDRLVPAQLSEPVQVGAGRVRALHPPPGESNPPGLPPPEKDLNAYSLVLSAEYGAGRFLFPGDLTPEGERLLVDRWGDQLAADVLVAPHHGGRGSLTPGFLAAVSPRYIVFSAGDPRRSPLPNHRTVARARRSGAQLLFTHRDGAVTFTADRRRVQVRTHR
jgi:competence protein ComEC